MPASSNLCWEKILEVQIRTAARLLFVAESSLVAAAADDPFNVPDLSSKSKFCADSLPSLVLKSEGINTVNLCQSK